MFISSIFNNVLDEFKNKNNSHSYIFYTNDFFSCQKDVYRLIAEIFNKDTIDNNDGDLIIIKSTEKKNILKEDMLDLKNMFKNTTYFNNYRIYLIEEAHKLNPTTSNMILKFLEEPMPGIIAFFITDNLDSVLSTIKSRCQIINAFYEKKEDLKLETEIKELEKSIFNDNKYISLLNIKNRYNNLDRNELIENFKKIIYNLSLNVNSINYKKIKLLNESITLLNKNVSLDYVFDYLLLKGCD